MPEELAFEEAFADGGAIEGDERLVTAPGAVVDPPGYKLLACPAFAFQQHDAIVGSHCVGDRYNPTEQRT